MFADGTIAVTLQVEDMGEAKATMNTLENVLNNRVNTPDQLALLRNITSAAWLDIAPQPDSPEMFTPAN